MIFNHLIVAFRNIRKQKIYNTLNILGLASGMAAGLIIALHIQEELSYEKAFPNYSNIYRIHSDQWAKSCPPLAILMRESFPDMAAIGRFAFDGSPIVNAKGENNAGQVRGFFADSSVFNVFGFQLVSGSRNQVLATPNTIVITRSMAKRFFGDQDPIGKLVHFDNNRDRPVIAVMEDLPKNSHLQFDYLISMPTFYENVSPEWTNHRGWMVMYTYVRFNSNQDYQKSLQLMPGFIRNFYQGWDHVEDMVKDRALRFQPLTDIHLRSHMEQEMSANSDLVYVYIFFAVELLILVVASANFMSLFTTQAIKRMKEVGMRKILGAKTGQLMSQFLTEVVVLMFIALVMAIVLYQLALPFYNSISGKQLGIWDVFEIRNLLIIGAMLTGVVVISGLYPVFFISTFRSGSFLKENKLPNSMPSLVRSGLVIFQFVVSISLIAASILVHQQMNLLQTKDLGFDKNQVVSVRLYGELWGKATYASDAFKGEFLKNPNVLAVGRVGNQIGQDLSVESLVPEGKEEEGDKYPTMRVLRVDEDYLTVMNIQLVAGRNFSHDHNDSSSLIINETAAKVLGLANPVDQLVTNTAMKRKGKIVGVVKDYHYASLRSKVEPLIIEWRPDWTGTLMIKIKAGATEETLNYLRKTIDKLAPGSLFVYTFLDDHINTLYKPEQAMGQVFQFFSVLAIVIACLGLLGLSAFTIESRTKEIGIRKVLGASIAGIVQLVTSRFFILIAVAYLISVPLTWYGMNRWLENFAYQIDIKWWVFAVTAVLIFGLALVTVGFNTIRAAVRNPVKSLRYE